MKIETVFNNGEPSMDNPPLITFPHLHIGDEFIFKGDKVVVSRWSVNRKGFWYTKINTQEEAYMSFSFYMHTPSAAGRKLK
jgi:hypothetical protein